MSNNPKKKKTKEIATIGAASLILGASILMNNEIKADEIDNDNSNQLDNEILNIDEQDTNTIVPNDVHIVDIQEFKDYGQKGKINPIEVRGHNDFDEHMRQFVHGGLDLKETKWSNYPSVVKIRIMNNDDTKWISSGSGVFIGSKSILSAGHLFKNDNGTWKIKPGDKIYYSFDSSSKNGGWDKPTTGVEYHVVVPENINDLLPDLTTNDKGETVYSSVIKDIAMIKVPVPIQLLYKGADFAEIGGMKDVKVGDTTSIIGYPAPDSREKKERILKQPIRGVLYESSGKVKGIKSDDKREYPNDVPDGVGRWIDSWNTLSHKWSHLFLNQDTSGGSSGAGVFNSEGKIIGILTGSLGEYGEFDWNMATMINNELLKNIDKFSDKTIGWYEYKGNKYFFDENQRLIKDQKKLINGNYYLFNEEGVMIKDLGKPVEANLYVNYLDTEGNTIKGTSRLLTNVPEGLEYKFSPIEIPGYEYVGLGDKSEPLSGNVKNGNFGIRLIYKQIKRDIKILAQDENGNKLNVNPKNNLGWTNVPEGQHYNIDPENLIVTDDNGEEYYFKESLNPLNSIVTSNKDTSGKIVETANTVTMIYEKRYEKSEEIKEITPEKTYLDTDKLLKGEELIKLKGHPGKESVITTYDKKTKTSLITETKTILKATKEIILRGTSDPIKIPIETTYINDNSLLEGEETIEKQGEEGLKHPNGKIIKEMSEKIIHKGTGKATEINFETIYQDSNEILEGDEDIIVEKGEKGLLHPNGKDIIKPAKRRVIKRGIGKAITIPKGEPEIEYDSSLDEGYEELIKKGEDGLKKPNGEIIKNPIKDIIKKGSKKIHKGEPENINPKETKQIILYVDENTNEVLIDSSTLDYNLPKKPPVFLNDKEYIYTNKQENKDGITKIFYKRNKPIESKLNETLIDDKPELEIPTEALKPEIHEKEEKHIIVYTDLDGNVLDDNTNKELPNQAPKTIKKGKFIYTGKSVIENGVTKHIYKNIINNHKTSEKENNNTNNYRSEKGTPEIIAKESKKISLLVDENENILDDLPENFTGIVPKYLENNKYVFTGKVDKENEIYKYIYQKLDEEVKNLILDKPELEIPTEALKPEIHEKEEKHIIVYTDLDGNVLDDNINKELPNENPKFIKNENYIYTGESKIEDGITKYIYEKVKFEKGEVEITEKPELEVPTEALKPEIHGKEEKHIIVYTDLDDNVLDDNTNKELLNENPKFIQNANYVYTGESKIEDGITKYIYEKVKFEKGESEITNKPELEIPTEVLKPEIHEKEEKHIIVYTDLNGNILEEYLNEESENEIPNKILNDSYIYTGLTSENDGIKKYIYDKIISNKPDETLIEEKPELEIPIEVLKPDIQPEKEEKHIIVYIDLDGNVLENNIDKEFLSEVPKFIQNEKYVYTGLMYLEDGITKYVFDKVLTNKSSDTLTEEKSELEIPIETLKPETQPEKEPLKLSIFKLNDGSVIDTINSELLVNKKIEELKNEGLSLTKEPELINGITTYYFERTDNLIQNKENGKEEIKNESKLSPEIEFNKNIIVDNKVIKDDKTFINDKNKDFESANNINKEKPQSDTDFQNNKDEKRKELNYFKNSEDVFSPRQDIYPEDNIRNIFSESETDKIINYLENSIKKDKLKENSNDITTEEKNKQEEIKKNETRAAAAVTAVSTAVGTVGGGTYLASNPDKFKYLKKLLKKIIK